MSNTDPTVESLQAEIDRLNSELASQSGGADVPATSDGAEQNIQPTHGPSVQRTTADGAKVIGAAADPRGGTIVAYSDGTVKLFNVPNQDKEPATPWGSAPDGEYVAFYTGDNGNEYNFVEANGTVATVENPVQNRA